jgi:hypothetical protein
MTFEVLVVIGGLFYNTVSIFDYIALSGRIVGE